MAYTDQTILIFKIQKGAGSSKFKGESSKGMED
jgi:hypothetical protein